MSSFVYWLRCLTGGDGCKVAPARSGRPPGEEGPRVTESDACSLLCETGQARCASPGHARAMPLCRPSHRIARLCAAECHHAGAAFGQRSPCSRGARRLGAGQSSVSISQEVTRRVLRLPTGGITVGPRSEQSTTLTHRPGLSAARPDAAPLCCDRSYFASWAVLATVLPTDATSLPAP